jgi:hypothetical protein
MYEDIPDGNLDESEYRFWVGNVLESSGFSECRACHKRVFNKSERIQHKMQVNEKNNACTVQLTDAYKILSQANKCVVCHEQTWNRRWGVPICPAVPCIKRFMFETTHWVQLEMALLKMDPAAPKIVEAVEVTERLKEDPDGWIE